MYVCNVCNVCMYIMYVCMYVHTYLGVPHGICMYILPVHPSVRLPAHLSTRHQPTYVRSTKIRVAASRTKGYIYVSSTCRKTRKTHGSFTLPTSRWFLGTCSVCCGDEFEGLFLNVFYLFHFCVLLFSHFCFLLDSETPLINTEFMFLFSFPVKAYNYMCCLLGLGSKTGWRRPEVCLST